jgi:hypothetical protein
MHIPPNPMSGLRFAKMLATLSLFLELSRQNGFLLFGGPPPW